MGKGGAEIRCTFLPEPGLAMVCKMIRHETLPVYYGDNTFALALDALSARSVARGGGGSGVFDYGYAKLFRKLKLSFEIEGTHERPQAGSWARARSLGPDEGCLALTLHSNTGKLEVDVGGYLECECACFLERERARCEREAEEEQQDEDGGELSSSALRRFVQAFEERYLRCYKQGSSVYDYYIPRARGGCERCGKPVRAEWPEV